MPDPTTQNNTTTPEQALSQSVLLEIKAKYEAASEKHYRLRDAEEFAQNEVKAARFGGAGFAYAKAAKLIDDLLLSNTEEDHK